MCRAQKLDAHSAGPAPGLRGKSAALTDAVERGSAVNDLTVARFQQDLRDEIVDAVLTQGPANELAGAAGWRVDDFRLSSRPRFYDDKMPSVRSQLEEAGAGRLSVPREGGGSSYRSAQSTDGAPKSMAEWAERNAFVPESARGGQGSSVGKGGSDGTRRASPDALSHPGLV